LRTFDDVLVGVLVGGASRRMGGQPKGLLLAPGGQERIVPRLLRLTQEALPGAECVLLGRHAAYLDLGVTLLNDASSGAGPLAGLVSLLRRAGELKKAQVLLLAGDLPRLSAALLVRLASFEADAPAVAPAPDGFFEPLFARYAPSCLQAAERALASDNRSLQALLRQLGAAPFPLSVEERALLVDWDEPADIDAH
jgi:molybdopterin-guanine dinucleotide biosynthesis protein A